MSGATAKFWEGFARGFSPHKAPMPAGIGRVVMCGRQAAGESLDVPPPVRMWVPRGHLKIRDREVHVVGPMRSLVLAHRRKPGVLQTIDLIAAVNPTGRKRDDEVRLLALAALHALISQGVVLSAEAHDVAQEAISLLGIDAHESGWATRTVRTLPGSGQNTDTPERQTDIYEIGMTVGSMVAKHLAAFVPVTVEFRDVRDASAREWSEIHGLLLDLKAATPVSGILSWRMMTPDKMNSLVWDASLSDLGMSYKVTATSLKKYCVHHSVELPPSGYWRMTKDRQEGLRALCMRDDQEDLADMIWRVPPSDLISELGVPEQALKDYCRMKGINRPSRKFWKMTQEEQEAVRQVEKMRLA